MIKELIFIENNLFSECIKDISTRVCARIHAGLAAHPVQPLGNAQVNLDGLQSIKQKQSKLCLISITRKYEDWQRLEYINKASIYI